MASTSTKITILVDNNAVGGTSADFAPDIAPKPGDDNGGARASAGARPAFGMHAPVQLATEHGLSFLIETGGKRVLLDTGQGPALASNVPALGVDLSTIDVLVLSHGHYDHTGGVPQVLREAPRAEVRCHPSVFSTRFSVRDGKAKYIGIPRDSARALRKLPSGRLRWVLGPTALSGQIGLTGPIPRLTGFEDTGGPFYQDKAGWRPDPLEDDLALWIRTEGGLVVCCGCAHSGAVNTLDYVRHLNQGMRIRAVVGGFHLINADEERLNRTIEALGALKIPLVIPCHCTGEDAFRRLAEALGERVTPGAAGMTLDF